MGWQLAAYRLLSRAIPLIAPALLHKRLARGKEDPQRWREKLGTASAPRPTGPLIWLNAVGLGEVLALRGLILAMGAQNPDTHFLVTSSTRASMRVLQGNLPPRTLHQFLPLDAPPYVAKFLRHWQPNLVVWAEQDLWPNAAVQANCAGVPMAMVNARMNAAAFARRRRGRGLFAEVLGKFDFIAAQDATSAQNLTALGARGVQVFPSLKTASPTLDLNISDFDIHSAQVAGRKVWLLASSWPQDEDIALSAHVHLLRDDPTALLIIAPRDISRARAISAAAAQRGLQSVCKTAAPSIAADVQVYIADTFGDMGLWYRLCRIALIGGSFGPTEGHNPWEAAVLGCAILHGPRTGNFTNDYAQLDAAQAAICVADSAQLLAELNHDHSPMAARAQGLAAAAKDNLAPLAAQLLALMR